jgi:hypothetical protein
MTEIIVYRSPAEAALWQMLSSGEFFPVFAGAIVGVIAMVLSAKIFDRVLGTFRQPKWASNLTLVVGAVAWVTTTYLMWI